MVGLAAHKRRTANNPAPHVAAGTAAIIPDDLVMTMVVAVHGLSRHRPRSGDQERREDEAEHHRPKSYLTPSQYCVVSLTAPVIAPFKVLNVLPR